MKYKKKIAPTYNNLVCLELFVLSISTLTSKEKNVCILVLTELIDNVISHSKPPFWSKIKVSLKKEEEIKIRISFISQNFKDFAKNYQKSKIKNQEVKFNEELNRYSGIGLKMCNNMTKAIVYSSGLLRNSIFVTI